MEANQNTGNNTAVGQRVSFPRPFAVAIDDMGWNVGNNSGDIDGIGPYRLGIDRKMDLKDYKAVVDVGKELGVRILGLFAMAEMDRENVLAELPSSTWMGEKWDNSANVSGLQFEIMNFVKENAAHLEFGLHGLGHEYWNEGKLKRAEWYNKIDKQPWPEEIMLEHLKYFQKILAQYGLNKENGHSFPESFVPCSYAYYWNPAGKYSTGALMSKAGIKYANTWFDEIRELNPPSGPNGGGYDNGVLVINRLNYGNDWYEVSKTPTEPLLNQKSDMIESHWSNWLAQDDFKQAETNQKWIDYFMMVQKSPDRYIAKNTEQFYSQWLHRKYTSVEEVEDGEIRIDNRNMPAEYYEKNLLGTMLLKVKLKKGEHISVARLNDFPIPSYYEDGGFGFIFLPKLNPQVYSLKYQLGSTMPHLTIYNDGTCNIYKIEPLKSEVHITLRIYGTQEIKISCPEPKSITKGIGDFQLFQDASSYLQGQLTIKLKATDIQGNTGKIILSY